MDNRSPRISWDRKKNNSPVGLWKLGHGQQEHRPWEKWLNSRTVKTCPWTTGPPDHKRNDSPVGLWKPVHGQQEPQDQARPQSAGHIRHGIEPQQDATVFGMGQLKTWCCCWQQTWQQQTASVHTHTYMHACTHQTHTHTEAHTHTCHTHIHARAHTHTHIKSVHMPLGGILFRGCSLHLLACQLRVTGGDSGLYIVFVCHLLKAN